MEGRNDTTMDNAPESISTEMSLRDHLLAVHAAASQQPSQSPPNTDHPHHPPPSHHPDQTDSNAANSPHSVNALHSPSQQQAPHPLSALESAHHQQHQPPPGSSLQQHSRQQQQQHQMNQQYPGALDPQIAAHAASQYGYPPHPMHGPHGDVSSPQQQAAIAAMSPPEDPDMVGLSAKQRRELSNSKRAAQNRAAQRAFRQRKESYIKKLEDDVRNASALPALQENLQRVQQENFHMRDYIMHLQSKLLDVTGSFPPPPQTLELRDPRSGQPIQTREREEGDGQGGPPPRPQVGSGGPERAPVATMSGGDRRDGEYSEQSAENTESGYPSYEGEKIERPGRPAPPPEGGQQVVA